MLKDRLFLRLLRSHFLLLLLELILAGFVLFHLYLLLLVLEGEGSEGIITSFGLIDYLKELLS